MGPERSFTQTFASLYGSFDGTTRGLPRFAEGSHVSARRGCFQLVRGRPIPGERFKKIRIRIPRKIGNLIGE